MEMPKRAARNMEEATIAIGSLIMSIKDVKCPREAMNPGLYFGAVKGYKACYATEVVPLLRALNRIALLGASELAYTSDFTEKVNMIVRGALKDE